MAESKRSLVDHFNVYRQIGNYAQLRKMAKRVQSDDTVNASEREAILKQIKTVEPDPLVFWIGVGSVAFAAILAFAFLL